MKNKKLPKGAIRTRWFVLFLFLICVGVIFALSGLVVALVAPMNIPAMEQCELLFGLGSLGILGGSVAIILFKVKGIKEEKPTKRQVHPQSDEKSEK